jgi:YfiR/HmsC-like
VWVLGAPAGAVEPELAQEAMILVKVLGYDRGLEPPIELVVVSHPSDGAAAARACDAFADALVLASSRVTVHGQAVAVRAHRWVDAATLTREAPPAGIVVCTDAVAKAREVEAAAQQLGALTFTRSPALARSVLAVGVVRDTARVGIVVNLAVAEGEGAQFASELLQLAEVVR